MRKTRRVLSLLCALAMLVSMFSAFTVVSAANDVAILAEVVEDTTMSADDGKVTYEFKLKGIDTLNSLYFVVPVDKDQFNCEIDMSNMAGNLANYVEAAGKAIISWSSTTAMSVSEDLVVATVTMTNKSAKLAAKQSIELEEVEIMVGNTIYDSSNTDIPELSVGMLAQQINNTVAVNKAGDTIAAGDTVEITFTSKGFDTVNSIYFVLPVDTDKFDCEIDMSKFAGNLANYVEAAGKAIISWSSTTAMSIEEGAEIAVVTLTAKTDVTDTITSELEEVEIMVGNIIYDSSNVDVAKVVIDPAAGPAVPVVTYNITVAEGIENGTISASATAAAAGKTVTVTATPADGYVLDTITVNGEAIEGTSFTMPESDVTVSATFKLAPVSYKLTLDVTKDSTVAAGSKVTVKATGEYADKFDVVVQVYNADGVAMGYVIFDEVAVDEENTFYAPAVCKISVNAVDEIGETSEDLLGNLVAAKVSK